jgi:plastocyanin
VKGRRRILVGVLALAAGGVLPAVAVSETTPTIEAVDGPGYYGEPHSWKPAEVTVAEGGAVTFSNPSGVVAHGLAWTGTGGQPTPSCSGGVPVNGAGTNWQGQCTFSHPGTYTFRCTVHPNMTGTITVNPNGTTTTTTTTTPPPGGGSGPPPSSTNPVSGSPSGSAPGSQPHPGPTVLLPAGSPLIAVTLPASQRGKSVHGSVQVSQAGVGGQLEVALSAGSGAVAKAHRPARVRVGRLVRSLLRSGTLSFAVPLSAKARRALERHRRLSLTVKVILVPAHGSAVGVTRSVVLHS